MTATASHLLAADPVAVARSLAVERLRPAAETVDQQGVDPVSLRAIGQAGLLGLAGPAEYGGGGAPAAVVREVNELLAGADLATWFVTTQHAMPLAVLAASPNTDLREQWLRPLCTGKALAGVAVAHLRRPGTPAVSATRTDDGWSFTGHVGWMTSWGLCDVMLLGALSRDGEVVFGLVPAEDAPGLRAGKQMRLAAMEATSTVAFDLDDFRVPDSQVAQVVDVARWLAVDAAKTANVSPAVIGLQAEITRKLAEAAAASRDATAADLCRRLQAEAEEIRTAAYALIDHVPAAEQIEDRLALRAHALELTLRSAAVLVTATGGSAMAASAPPQRHLREAAFLLVQAQTGPVREATLERWQEQTA